MVTPRATLLATLATLVLSSTSAIAAPELRTQVDQRGNFHIIGNTLGQDCGAGVPAPIVGTVGLCGVSTADSSPDVYWRSDSPTAGAAQANAFVTAAQARSTAVLQLPAGATVTMARLYWAGRTSGTVADTSVTLDRPGGFSQALTADDSLTGAGNTYQATADISALVQAQGEGAYRITGVDSLNFVNRNDEVNYAAWWIVLFYEDFTDPPRNLTLFDGLDEVDVGQPQAATLSGFLVPDAGFDAQLGVITYEGDDQFDGDSLSFGPGVLTDADRLSDAVNPIDNFFNGTRSLLGSSLTVAGDLPQLSGAARSMGGVDFDIVDVTSRVSAGQTSANIQATSSLDRYYLSAFVTSISTFRPNFASSEKSVAKVGPDPILPGDELEYTINVANTGNDIALGLMVTDPLPVGVTYSPGTLEIVSGPGAGLITDASGDDQGEYDAATRTVTFRLGTGADAGMGGSLGIGGTTVVRFRVTVDPTAVGAIENQAEITASGQQGAPISNWPTDGNGSDSGAPPTVVVVDQCVDDTLCAAPTPRCDTSATPRICVECLAEDDCGGTTPVCELLSRTCVGCEDDTDCAGSTPACQPAGNCGECSATNTTQCTGATSLCDTPSGTCVGCITDADCGGTTPVCDGTTQVCVPCTMDADCPAASPACQASGACGECSASNDTACVGATPVCDVPTATCVGCLSDDDCGGLTPACNTATDTCEPCASDADCSSPTPACQATGDCGECSATNDSECTGATPLCNANTATCVSCLADTDCGGATPVCNPSTGTCEGCATDADCSSPTPACQGSGECGECSASNDSECTGATPVCNANTATCVGCLADADCGGATPVCNTAAGTCEPCASDADCSSPTPACQGSGECGECSAANDSECTGATPLCNANTATCVGCLADADCSGNTPVCDATSGTCQPCASDADCASPVPACQPSGGCGECSDANQTECGGATPACDTSSGTCVGCRDNTDCGGATPACDANSGICVGCTADADCTGLTPNCDTATNTCTCVAAADEICGNNADDNCNGEVDEDCLDTDGDGLTDVTETAIGTDPNDADSDDDGVLDGDEPDYDQDTDGDGLINALDPDSDDDGLFDGTELGLDCSHPATDLTMQACIADADNGTTTNPLDRDGDAGGTTDGSEDSNLNGQVDPGEGDPLDGSDDSQIADLDGDGLSDALENFLGSNPDDGDSDDDGLPDGEENNPSHDTDGDGLLNVLDVDSDDDALHDGTEAGQDCSNPDTDVTLEHCIADADPSTTTSTLIRDTDNGGVIDGSEDANRNGQVDSGETDPTAGNGADDVNVIDTDGDQLSDDLETTLGSDPDDADSDDDGLLDGEERNPGDDRDGDGELDVNDPDSDGDGLFDGTEAGRDCSHAATNLAANRCVADADNGATITGVLQRDTDRGGASDGAEDRNRNGRVDVSETDPNDPLDDCVADAGCVPDGGVLPDGSVAIPDGGGLPDGSIVLPDGRVVRPDAGTLPDGSIALPDGRVVSPDAATLPDGGLLSPDAALADGSTSQDGALPDGALLDAALADGGDAARGRPDGASASGDPGAHGWTLEGGGCGCSIPDRGTHPARALLLLGALGLWLSRRRGGRR